jgi:hypothetical protein
MVTYHSHQCENYAAVIYCAAQAEELLSWMATLVYTGVTRQLPLQLVLQNQQQRQQLRCQMLTSEHCSTSKMAAAAVLQRAELRYSSNCL